MFQKSGKVITGFRIDEPRVELVSGHLCRCALNTFRDAGQLGRSCIALILWPDLSKDDGCASETAFQASVEGAPAEPSVQEPGIKGVAATCAIHDINLPCLADKNADPLKWDSAPASPNVAMATSRVDGGRRSEIACYFSGAKSASRGSDSARLMPNRSPRQRSIRRNPV